MARPEERARGLDEHSVAETARFGGNKGLTGRLIWIIYARWMLKRFSTTWLSIAATAVAGWISIPTLGYAGERIQFSVPTEPQERQVDLQRIRPRNEGFFEGNKSPAGGPSMSAPVQSVRPTTQEDRDKQRNWLSARPEDSAATAQDIFKVKPATEEKPATFLGQEIQQANQPLEQRRSQFDAQTKAAQELQRSFSTPKDVGGLWSRSTLLPASKDLFGERPATFADLWSSKFTLRDLMTDQNRLGSPNPLVSPSASHSSAMRPLADSINSFSDATRQEANPFVGTSTDFMSRSSQTTIADQWKNGGSGNVFAGERTSALENMNARSLGPSSNFEVKRPDPIVVKPQPAVLPFPARPGEILNRPRRF